jgi:hypothetical protein
MRSRWHTTSSLILAVAAILCLPEDIWPQAATPIPPGHSAANRATRNAENVEAPSPPAQNVTAAQVLQQADEMLSLAQQVRADAERATQGVLAKDLKDNLKRIEKLSKRLREELAPQ